VNEETVGARLECDWGAWECVWSAIGVRGSAIGGAIGGAWECDVWWGMGSVMSGWGSFQF